MGAIYNASKLRNHPEFIACVQTAVVKVATDVYGEAATVPNHAIRMSLAQRIIFDAQSVHSTHIIAFTFLCAADTAIRTAGYVSGAVNAEAIPDTDFLRVVTGAWVPMAQTILQEA